MKRILLISYILIALILPLGYICEAEDISVRPDLQMHWMAGWGSTGLFRAVGYDKNQAFALSFLSAVGYECYQEASHTGKFECDDIAAAMLGAYSFEIAEGVYVRFIYRGK